MWKLKVDWQHSIDFIIPGDFSSIGEITWLMIILIIKSLTSANIPNFYAAAQLSLTSDIASETGVMPLSLHFSEIHLQ